jgi:hypothetical protein
MIFYDFDGVFLSDCEYGLDGIEGVKYLEMRRDFPRPIFVPRGEYGIITGRNKTDYEYTKEYIDKWFPTPPKVIYHDCFDYRVGREYKASVINKHNIKVFVESCPSQAGYLTDNCPSCKIIIFRELINEVLSKL